MKVLKIITLVIALLTVLSINNLFSQGAPPSINDDNTFILDVTCKPAFFEPNSGTVNLTPNVEAGSSQTFDENEMKFTIWGDGTKTYDVEITLATNKYPPTGIGPFAYIVTEWTYLDRNQTVQTWVSAEQGDKFQYVTPIEEHCDGHAEIFMRAVSGSADPNYPADDDVPFLWKLTITEN